MDAAGRWTGITVVTPVPRWWAAWLRWNFGRLERGRRRGRRSQTIRDLERLSFIAFAHWAVFRPFRRAERNGPSRPPYGYLLFQSNFNGAPKQYVEAFSRVMPTGMRALWMGAHGVPPPLPVAPFEDHIMSARLESSVYWSAYPDASTKMVVAALRLRDRLGQLAREATALDDETFAAEYEEFLTDVQRLL